MAADIPADPGPGTETADAERRTTTGRSPSTAPGSGLSALQRRLAGAVTGLLGLVGVGVMMLFGVLLVAQAHAMTWRTGAPKSPGWG